MVKKLVTPSGKELCKTQMQSVVGGVAFLIPFAPFAKPVGGAVLARVGIAVGLGTAIYIASENDNDTSAPANPFLPTIKSGTSGGGGGDDLTELEKQFNEFLKKIKENEKAHWFPNLRN
ncbi:MAG: hypothetical protein FWB72_07200 [Firmicutes bacterium]|nr:hypothetical protein [Bacillota bacterium]